MNYKNVKNKFIKYLKKDFFLKQYGMIFVN